MDGYAIKTIKPKNNMTKKEHKEISKLLSPRIATKFKELEQAFDDHFTKHYARKDYKVLKKITQTSLIQDFIPMVRTRLQNESEKMMNKRTW